MKIGIDARFTTHGVGRCIEELIKHLALIDNKNEYVILASEDNKYIKENIFGDNFKIIITKAPVFSLTEQLIIPYYIEREKLDLFHSTSYLSFLIRRCPFIVTIHDLLCKVNEDYYPPSSTLKKYVAKGYYNFMNWYAINYSSRIITVSEFARTEIKAFFPKIDRNKINVIYNGVSSDFRRADHLEIEKVKLKYGIFHKYLLFVGTLNPRKNLIGLIKAFARIDALKENDYKLVVAARKDKRYSSFLNYIKRPDLIDRIILLNYVPKEDLPPLYSAAEALVFPSFHESFGFPVVEAFACGTPVITSNVTALPEIAADAAYLIDPHNIDELSSAISCIISEGNLRKELVEKGFNRIKYYSWKIAAEKLLTEYEKVHKERNKA